MPTATSADRLDKGDAVLAAVDLRGVPAGTGGKVSMVSGLSWIRYWVRFENGMDMGSINRSKLSTPAEWDRRHDEPVAAAAPGAASDGEADDDDAPSGGGGAEVNGALIPQKLLDRSAAARQRLGG